MSDPIDDYRERNRRQSEALRRARETVVLQMTEGNRVRFWYADDVDAFAKEIFGEAVRLAHWRGNGDLDLTRLRLFVEALEKAQRLTAEIEAICPR